MTEYGRFNDFCRDSGSRHATIPVCNLFNQSPARSGNDATGFGGCELTGIGLSNGRVLANLGSILFDAIAILVTLALLWFSNRKRAAVGRREMQYFLFGYLVISICEIFTVGGFPLDGAVRRGFTALHIAAVVATTWVLLLNAIVGFQIMEDGTPLSMALIIGSSLAFIIGVGYVSFDTAFRWTGYWNDTLDAPNQAYALYTLYLLAPLLFIAVYFILETFLVVAVLGERRPLLYLLAAAILFALGQIFQFVVSVHICNGANGRINGGMFETLFTLLAVVMIWVFWSSITEDDWPTAGTPDVEDVARTCRRLNRPSNRNGPRKSVKRRRRGRGWWEHPMTIPAIRYDRWRGMDPGRHTEMDTDDASSTTKRTSSLSSNAFEMGQLTRPESTASQQSTTIPQGDGCLDEALPDLCAGPVPPPERQSVDACQSFSAYYRRRRRTSSDHSSEPSEDELGFPPLPPDPVFIQVVFQQPVFGHTRPENIPLPPPTPDEHRPIPDPFYPNPGTRTPSGEPPSPQLPPSLIDRTWRPDVYLPDVPMALQRIRPRMETQAAWQLSSQIFEPREDENSLTAPTHSSVNRVRPASSPGSLIEHTATHGRSESEVSMIESLFNYSQTRRTNRIRSSVRTSYTPDSLPSTGRRPPSWWLEHAGESESGESAEASVGERRWPRWWRRLSLTSRIRVKARAQALPRSRVRAPPPSAPPLTPLSDLSLPEVPTHEPGGSQEGGFDWVDPDQIGIAL